MGYVMIAAIITAIVIGLSALLSDRSDKLVNMVWGGVISGAICGLFIFVPLCVSYSSYVDLRTGYDGVVEQYRGAVEMYADYATIDMGRATTFTDFKYKGYQDNISGFIKDLRSTITWYNKELISKRVMDKNFFFNWIITEPDDDMKVINIVTKEHKERMKSEECGDDEARGPGFGERLNELMK